MQNIESRLNSELRRLDNGPTIGERPRGLGTVRFLVRCPIGTNEPLRKVKEVLRIVDVATLSGWPTRVDLAPCLPEWFTSTCIAETTPEEANRWLAWWKNLPPDEQTRAEIEKDWSLNNWLYWMKPENRQWFWWDAKVLEQYDHIALAIEVEAWPFPWGALRWLFRAAGASAVEAEA